MQFHRILLFFFLYHRCTFISGAYSINNSSMIIDLHHCHSNTTIVNVTTIATNAGFNDRMKSCDFHCCLNDTTSSHLCQVIVHTIEGNCLGHLCYADECDKFISFIIPIANSTMKNKTTFTNQLRSSFTSISRSSFVNKIQTQWSTWFNQTDSNIRHTVIIILFIVNIILTLLALLFVIKSIRRANLVAEERPYHYTLL